MVYVYVWYILGQNCVYKDAICCLSGVFGVKLLPALICLLDSMCLFLFVYPRARTHTCPHTPTKNHGEGTAQITTQGHRGTLFSSCFQISGDRGTQLLRAAAPMSKKTLVGAAIRSREDHPDEKITHHEVGWSPLRNPQLTSEVDRFLTGKSPKCLRL
jgi:hypothetical protein